MPLQADVQIEIQAPPERVWQAMVDFDRYGEWNPFIPHVETDRLSTPMPQVGDRMRLHVSWVDAEGGQTESGEKLVVFQPPDGDTAGELSYRFTGLLPGLGLIRATRVQRIQRLPDGSTQYRSVEVFRGLLSGSVPLARVQAGFDAHAQALKAWCESDAWPQEPGD